MAPAMLKEKKVSTKWDAELDRSMCDRYNNAELTLVLKLHIQKIDPSGGTVTHPDHDGTPRKIVAWGGFASVRHVTRYIQPGLELISLDPKRSATIIGKDTFADEATMRDAALRAATDIGASNQTGCSSARAFATPTAAFG